MKDKKIITNYSNVTAYTKSKIDSDIEKVSKAILRLEDFIFNYKDKLQDKQEELAEQKELLNKLTDLKRFN
jgi:hypothetical protein